MDATEIFRLTEDAVERLLTERAGADQSSFDSCRRKTPRWPFPGTVELWIPDEAGVEQIELGTCINLGHKGLGMLLDMELPVGMELALAVHQPELSLQGRVVVKHCTEIDDGCYIGVQFLFEDADS